MTNRVADPPSALPRSSSRDIQRSVHAQAADYARFRPIYPQSSMPGWRDRHRRQLSTSAPATGRRRSRSLTLRTRHRRRAERRTARQRDRRAVGYWRGAAGDGLPAGSADLLTVARRSTGWREAFLRRSAAAHRAASCVWCHGLTTIRPRSTTSFTYYEDLLGPFWEPERSSSRKLPERGCRSPRSPRPRSRCSHRTFEHLLGYLGTWSPRTRLAGRQGRAGDRIPAPARGGRRRLRPTVHQAGVPHLSLRAASSSAVLALSTVIW
jgi:hypothetical protein